jgi:hypothetical protein
MNGTEPKIEIFKPFGEAFELMKKILFQPFDLGKWCVVGFAAFLASLSGGFGYSFNLFSHWGAREDRKAIAESFPDLGHVAQMEWWVIALMVIGGLIILALVLVFMWLGARGRFIFTDCVVCNRGAIVAPWKEFRGAGKQFLSVFTAGHAVHFCRGRSRGVGAVVPPDSPRLRQADRPGFLDRPRRVRVFHFVPRVRLGVGLAGDDTDHVSPTLPGPAGLQPKCRINRSSAGPDASLFLVSPCNFIRCRCAQLLRGVPDLLHRGDSLHRHSRSAANSGYPPRVLDPVSAPIRF